MNSSTDDDWAHAPPECGKGETVDAPHGLNTHLREVGGLAKEFAHVAAGDIAYLAGLWHDLGKRRPGFQSYIRQAGGAEAHIEGRVRDRDKTHSAAGALWAEQYMTDALAPRAVT